MSETWRLLIDPPLAGALNMAIDEAILGAVGAGESPPTLRLYAWQPACLSLGYAQASTDVDRARLAERGWGVVRRMTGGRAILHTDELTYSVTLPAAHPLATGGIIERYRRLSAALLGALHALGLAADADKRAEGAAKRNGPVCFETPSDYEITAGGKKLIGSAQVRRQAAVLQHGSVPLVGDLSRICEALYFPDELARSTARSRVLERATSLSDALGQRIEWRAAANALIAACESAFDVQFADGEKPLCLRERGWGEGELSESERAQAETLCNSRYGADSWTFRA